MGDGEHITEGAFLSADRIAYETRKMSKPEVFQMSATHKGTRGKLLKKSFAIIERAWTIPKR